MSRSDWPRIVATGAFTVVSLVAAAISYDHIARAAGPHWYALLLPLSVDGLMVAGSIALFLERSQGRWGGALAWAATVLGLAASLAANIAAADPGVQGVLVAGWPPVALALAFELLIRVRRVDAPAPVVGVSEPQRVRDLVADPAGPAPAPTVSVTPEPSAPARAQTAAPSGDAKEAAVKEAAEWAAGEIRQRRPAGRETLRGRFPNLSADDARAAARLGRELAAAPAVRLAPASA